MTLRSIWIILLFSLFAISISAFAMGGYHYGEVEGGMRQGNLAMICRFPLLLSMRP